MAASKVKSEQCTKGFSYSSVLVALLAVGGAYVYFDRTSSLNKFSAAMTGKLCDMLPKVEDATPPTEETVATPPEIKISKSSTHYTPADGETYDAKGELVNRPSSLFFIIKFIYSEKVTKFCKIFTLLLWPSLNI